MHLSSASALTLSPAAVFRTTVQQLSICGCVLCGNVHSEREMGACLFLLFSACVCISAPPLLCVHGNMQDVHERIRSIRRGVFSALPLRWNKQGAPVRSLCSMSADAVCAQHTSALLCAQPSVCVLCSALSVAVSSAVCEIGLYWSE